MRLKENKNKIQIILAFEWDDLPIKEILASFKSNSQKKKSQKKEKKGSWSMKNKNLYQIRRKYHWISWENKKIKSNNKVELKNYGGREHLLNH